MFGNKEKSHTVGSGHTTLVAKGTEIIGELRFSGNLEIEGIVRGNLVANEGAESALVRIQPSGEVQGDIVCPTVVVNSRVEGNIYSSKRVELSVEADVCGDVYYQIIEMLKGSQVNGSLMYSPNAAPDRDIEPNIEVEETEPFSQSY